MNSEIEQAFVTMRELLPRGWWAVYQGSLQVGFDKYQAFANLQTYIMAQTSSAGLRPADGCGPKSDSPEDE